MQAILGNFRRSPCLKLLIGRDIFFTFALQRRSESAVVG